MANIGYVRVSTKDQNLDLQLDAMKAAGVERVFRDEGVSGSVANRPGLDATLDFLREEDTLVVWRLDRLGRSTKNVLSLLDGLTERGVKFRSLTEGFDTSGPLGALLVTLIAAFAQLERDTIRERTMSGLEAARSRGKFGGRPSLLNETQHTVVRNLYDAQKLSVAQIAEQMNVSVQTIYRSLRTSAPVSA